MRCTGIIATGTLLIACGGAMADGPIRTVQVTQATLLATPAPFADAVGTVKYKDEVQVKTEKAPFVEVTAAGKTGWLHNSALLASNKKLEAANADPKTRAKLAEEGLAGRGFGSEFEKQFKAAHPDSAMAFAALDAAVKSPAQNVSPQELQKFVKDGNLNPAGGAQ